MSREKGVSHSLKKTQPNKPPTPGAFTVMENLSVRKETQETLQNKLWKKVGGSCAVSRGLKELQRV